MTLSGLFYIDVSDHCAIYYTDNTHKHVNDEKPSQIRKTNLARDMSTIYWVVAQNWLVRGTQRHRSTSFTKKLMIFYAKTAFPWERSDHSIRKRSHGSLKVWKLQLKLQMKLGWKKENWDQHIIEFCKNDCKRIVQRIIRTTEEHY